MVSIPFVLALAFAAGPSSLSAPPVASSAPVVELGRGGLELPAPRRRAVEQALLSAADAAGLVVCRAGTALSQPDSPALDRVCAQPGLPRLWWDAEIGTEKSGDVFVLDVLLKLAIGGPAAESPVSIVPPHAILPAGLEGDEGENAVLDAVDRSLLATAELRAWLAGLKGRSELLRATVVTERTRPASAEELRTWDREIQAIADLLIDGRYLEGRDRAARLLREDLTPEVAARARELRVKAETKLATAGSLGKPGAGAPGAAGIVGERGQIEIRPARPTPPAQKRWERGFDVRVAKDDRGFADGVDGRLTVTTEGISFTRQGASRPDWSIAWADLAAAHRAEGIWDVPYPLALAEKGGRLHHLVRVDPAGKPLSGGAILSALAEGRLASRKGYS